jgi:hypothetical protein
VLLLIVALVVIGVVSSLVTEAAMKRWRSTIERRRAARANRRRR